MSLIEAAAPTATAAVAPPVPQPFANPDAASGEALALSPVARSALDAIGSLHAGFEALPEAGAEAAPPTVEIDPASQPAPEVTPEAAMQQMAQQIEASIQTQVQLAHFVMTSSVSSSLGRNLNMFLRGQ